MATFIGTSRISALVASRSPTDDLAAVIGIAESAFRLPGRLDRLRSKVERAARKTREVRAHILAITEVVPAKRLYDWADRFDGMAESAAQNLTDVDEMLHEFKGQRGLGAVRTGIRRLRKELVELLELDRDMALRLRLLASEKRTSKRRAIFETADEALAHLDRLQRG